MRKSIAFILVLALCALSTAGSVCADADSTSTMVLRENSNVYKINGKDFNFEKPYTDGDTLMSCLDPIIKTMNIALEKSSDGKTLTLKYSGSTIVMYVGSKEAVVDGVKTVLSHAPVSVNGSIMVPLRFVAESFGGEVSVDGETKDITVRKEIAGDNSIKDFALLLKKTNKEIVGDSYYKWTMSLPKDVKISYRSFNGAYSTFEAVDGSYSISLSIYDLPSGETFDTLIESELQYAEDYTLISQEKSNKDGFDYYRIAYKDDGYIYEERDFVKNNKVYELYLEIEDADIYKNNKELSALLDSFKPGFVQDGRIEDLSDVIAGGYRIYEDKKLEYSIKVPADWQESAYDNKENEVTFTEPYKDTSTYQDRLMVITYSKEDGITLDKWYENELKALQDEYNPELVKLVESGDITVGNVRAKKLICSTKLKTTTSYSYNVYIMGDTYKYHLYYDTVKPYANKIIQSNINYLLESFVFAEPEPDDTESFLDPDGIIRAESVRSIEDKSNGYSFELPTSWQKNTSSAADAVSYSNKDKTINFVIGPKKGVT
ncbi:MAG TPA: copper amine oxidase N-terminal domain-containing protein, partial [Clostridia bacterium]|nr:copper amine oxidase N-terminal domain-containing protein [Clostridia bacterium]